MEPVLSTHLDGSCGTPVTTIERCQLAPAGLPNPRTPRSPSAAFCADVVVGLGQAEIGATLGVALAADEGALTLVADLEGRCIALGIVRASHEASRVRALAARMPEHEHTLAIGRAPGEYAGAALAGVQQRALLVGLAGCRAGAAHAELARPEAIAMLATFYAAALDTVG